MEIGGQPVIARRNSAEVFDAIEHPLDGVTIAIEHWREAALPRPSDFGRNVGCCAMRLDFLAHGVGVVTFVTLDDGDPLEVFEQGVGRGAIGNLAASQQESDRAAVYIGQGVDLGRAAAARAADRLAVLPPFPPEAQRCAFTAEESISTSAGGPPAVTRARNISAQIPFAAQRWNRL